MPYNAAEWTSRADYDTWRAESVRTDDMYDVFVEFNYTTGINLWRNVRHQAPAIDPYVPVEELGNYSLESLDDYINDSGAGKPSVA
jgi:hypothetical protein